MTDHPEFPQERPAVQYLVEQVSKIEGAQACATGYYRTLGKVFDRLDKLDTLLVQLKKEATDLKTAANGDQIAAQIGRTTNVLDATLREAMNIVINDCVEAIADPIAKIEHKTLTSMENFDTLIDDSDKGYKILMDEIRATNTKLNAQIATVEGCMVITSGRALIFGIVILVVGVVIGYVIK